jgi:hypothetical protein
MRYIERDIEEVMIECSNCKLKYLLVGDQALPAIPAVCHRCGMAALTAATRSISRARPREPDIDMLWRPDYYNKEDYFDKEALSLMQLPVPPWQAPILMLPEEQEKERLEREKKEQFKRIQAAAEKKKKKKQEEEALKKWEEERRKRPVICYPALRTLRRLLQTMQTLHERALNYLIEKRVTIAVIENYRAQSENEEDALIDKVSACYGQCNLLAQYAEAQEYEILMEERRGKS